MHIFRFTSLVIEIHMETPLWTLMTGALQKSAQPDMKLVFSGLLSTHNGLHRAVLGLIELCDLLEVAAPRGLMVGAIANSAVGSAVYKEQA